MYYEDVIVASGETVSALAMAYGHGSGDWKRIWEDGANRALTTRRSRPELVQISDILHVPIPWKMGVKTLVVTADGVSLTVTRTGARGSRLSWLQTVYQHNQPIAGTSAFCVDGCPPDDADPFYWTSAELAADPTLRKTFKDVPSRPPPGAAVGTTKWRAVLSIGIVTGKRVTVIDPIVWGFDVTPAGVYTKVGPRPATKGETEGHRSLLQRGQGTGGPFSALGWSFRAR